MIKNNDDYNKALVRVDEIFKINPEPSETCPEHNELLDLVHLIELYEDKQWPMK